MKFITWTHKDRIIRVPVGNSSAKYQEVVGRQAMAFNDRQPILSKKLAVLDRVFDLAAEAKKEDNRDAFFFLMDVWKKLEGWYLELNIWKLPVINDEPCDHGSFAKSTKVENDIEYQIAFCTECGQEFDTAYSHLCPPE